MGNAFSNSWNLIKASFNVLQADRELLLFPFISMLGTILVGIVFSIPLFLSGIFSSTNEGSLSSGQTVTGVVVLFLFYLVMYTIVIFSNVALVGAAMMRMNGQDPTVSDGFRIAMSHLRQIVGYAAISATVGVVLSLLRGNDNNILGRIIAGIIGFAWNVVTFLVVPVLVIENVGPIDAIKRSGQLLRKTWGEQLVTGGGMGLIFGLVTFAIILIVGVPLVTLAATSGSLALILVAIVVLVFVLTLLGLVGSALNGIFQAALYNFAASGNPGPYFDQAQLSNAFRPRR